MAAAGADGVAEAAVASAAFMAVVVVADTRAARLGLINGALNGIEE